MCQAALCTFHLTTSQGICEAGLLAIAHEKNEAYGSKAAYISHKSFLKKELFPTDRAENQNPKPKLQLGMVGHTYNPRNPRKLRSGL
jgi:hypothetical protein